MTEAKQVKKQEPKQMQAAKQAKQGENQPKKKDQHRNRIQRCEQDCGKGPSAQEHHEYHLTTRPYVVDLGEGGHVNGVTYLSPETSTSTPSPQAETPPVTSSSSLSTHDHLQNTKDDHSHFPPTNAPQPLPPQSNRQRKTPIPLVHHFPNIRYALPPTGLHRWRQPRPLPNGWKYDDDDDHHDTNALGGSPDKNGTWTSGVGVCPQPGGKGKGMWTEDCLGLSIWVPAGEPEVGESGWPVLFYIHGGFLQNGTPNTINPLPLLTSTPCKTIIVVPAYRLNLFGFLASPELADEAGRDEDSGAVAAGNYGFWDLRCALEWTKRWIGAFGGDVERITVGGHSAGAHAAFHLLSHDLYLPPTHRLPITRVLLLSQSPGMPPKPLHSLQTTSQFTALLHALHIPLTLPASAKLAALRATPAEDLVAAIEKMGMWHQFRAVTDGDFVRREVWRDIENGEFARRVTSQGVMIVLGEVPDEHFVYATHRPPRKQNLAELVQRLSGEFPAKAVEALVKRYYCPTGDEILPRHIWPGEDVKKWSPDVFGRVYADLQVHALQRGFIDRLVRGGAGGNLFRYRIEWRAGFLDGLVKREWGVTHGTDVVGVWLWGAGARGWDGEYESDGNDGGNLRSVFGGWLSGDEKEAVKGFAEPWWEFVGGKRNVDVKHMRGLWSARAEKGELRRLRADGVTDVVVDDGKEWERGVRVWDIVVDALREEWEDTMTMMKVKAKL